MALPPGVPERKEIKVPELVEVACWKVAAGNVELAETVKRDAGLVVPIPTLPPPPKIAVLPTNNREVDAVPETESEVLVA